MGKWFDGFRDAQKEEALEYGKKKGLPVMEVVENGNRKYFVGMQLPKAIQKGLGVSTHVLWRPIDCRQNDIGKQRLIDWLQAEITRQTGRRYLIDLESLDIKSLHEFQALLRDLDNPPKRKWG